MSTRTWYRIQNAAEDASIADIHVNDFIGDWLDSYWGFGVTSKAFIEQIDLAHRVGLPLVIHTREAWEETFDLLAEHGVPSRTVFHCFTGGPEEAARCVEMGTHLSISGIVTW